MLLNAVVPDRRVLVQFVAAGSRVLILQFSFVLVTVMERATALIKAHLLVGFGQLS